MTRRPSPDNWIGGRDEKDVPTSSLDRGYWTRLKEEVDEGFRHFWSQDQICGFTKEGERIGTGIPRELRQYEGNHEYSL